MAILAVDEARGLFDHVCSAPGCGYVTRGLRLDPAKGDLTPLVDLDGQTVVGILVRRCPLCRSTETLTPSIPAWEAAEPEVGPDGALGDAIAVQPGSLVGTAFPDTHAVVTEHSHGHLPTPDHVAAARLIRRMQRHPDLAPHAPVCEVAERRRAAAQGAQGAQTPAPQTAPPTAGQPAGLTAEQPTAGPAAPSTSPASSAASAPPPQISQPPAST